MVEYYNLSLYSNNSGIIDIWRTTETLSGGIFGGFMLIVIFSISLGALIKSGRDTNSAFHLSSLYTLLAAIFLYLAQIISTSIYIFIPAMIYVITLFIRWYNNDQ